MQFVYSSQEIHQFIYQTSLIKVIRLKKVTNWRQNQNVTFFIVTHSNSAQRAAAVTNKMAESFVEKSSITWSF